MRDLGQGPTEYLELRVGSSSLTILMPAESLEQAGLRAPATREEAETILALLAAATDVPAEWAERNTATHERMKSRRLDQVAMAVRDLTRHQQRIGRPLNAGEQAALNSGLTLLARELSLSLDLPEDETLALIAERAAGNGSTAV